MNENSIVLKRRTIIWIVVFLSIFVIVIIGFNKIDNNRKFHQFESINEVILTSDYPEKLSFFLNNFSKDDSSLVLKIKETLFQLEDDFDNIDDSRIYLADGSTFIEFTSYTENGKLKSYRIINFIPKEIRSLKEYLDKHTEIDLKELFNSAEKDKNYIYTLIKVGKGYLYLKDYRY